MLIIIVIGSTISLENTKLEKIIFDWEIVYVGICLNPLISTDEMFDSLYVLEKFKFILPKIKFNNYKILNFIYTKIRQIILQLKRNSIFRWFICYIRVRNNRYI